MYSEATRCIVKGCQNHREQGGFVGDLCSPCYVMLKHGTYKPSFAFFCQDMFAVRRNLENMLDVVKNNSNRLRD